MAKYNGCLRSPYDIRDYRLKSTTSKKLLPNNFELKKPKIKDQSDTNSCVAHACSYINEFFNSTQNHNNDQFATEFIYGYRPNDYYLGRGMYPREAFKTMLELGNVKKKDFNYNNEMPEAKTNVDDNLEYLNYIASPNRISSYFRLYNEKEIKEAIMNSTYVFMNVDWYNDIVIDSSSILRTSNISFCGRHAITVYGWCEEGWLCANSWGTEWGNNGCFIYPYDLPFIEAWGFTDEIKNISIKKYNIVVKYLYKIINKIVNNFKK